MTRPPPARDDAAPWAAVFSVAVASFALVTTEFLPVGLLSAIAHELGVSVGAAGLMISLPGAMAALAAPVLTVVSKTLDRRILLLAMTACLIVSDVVSALTPGFGLMLAARALLGVAIGGFWAVGAVVGGRLVGEVQAGRATAIIFSGISLGALLGVPVGVFLGALSGWRAAFWAAGGLSLAILAAQAIWLPRLPGLKPVRVKDLFGIFANRNARVGLLAVFFAVAGQFAAYTFINPVLLTLTRLSPKALSQVFLAYGVAGFIGNFLGGQGAAKNIRAAKFGVLLVLGLIIVAFARLAGDPPAAIALVAAWGLVWGALPILHQAWALRASPNLAEGGSALFVAVFQGSIALGAGLGGAAVQTVGLAAGMTLGGLSILIALAVSALGSKPFS